MGIPWSEVPQELVERAQDEQELLMRLRMVSGDAGPILKALVDAVAVLGYSHVKAGLTIMSRVPPSPFKRPASVYDDPDVRTITEQRRLLDRMQRETTQGTAVAPNKRLYSWEFAKPGPWREAPTYTPPTVFCDKDGCFQDHVKGGRYCLIHTINAKLDAIAADALGGPDWQDVIDPATARRVSVTGDGVVGFNAKLYAPPDLGHYDEPEAEVDEAVTPAILALMAEGKVAEAQKLILDGLASYHQPEAVYIPPNAPVMPAPRAGTMLPALTQAARAQINEQLSPRAPTGKPCRVCMRDAYHIHSSPTGKPWHYCDAHEPENV